MSKMEGKKIVIQFNHPLLGDVTGNAGAFTISAQEYLYVDGPDNNGPIITKNYTVQNVIRIPAEVVYIDTFGDGTLSTLEIKNGALILARTGG